MQYYKLNKFSENSDIQYEDWYPVEDEEEADLLNRKYTGIELENKMKEVYRSQS